MSMRNRFSADKGPRAIRVVTGSRIHLGFYGFDDKHRLYGGLGLALYYPTYDLVVSPAKSLSAEGCQSERAFHFARRVLDLVDAGFELSITIRKCIPQHVGLGSTTQLALAIYVAAAKLASRSIDLEEVAKALGRGAVSGIGLTAFARGGFIVDAGLPPLRPSGYVVKPLLRLRFPRDWVPLLAVPKVEWRVAEHEEPALFRKAGGLSPEQRAELLYTVFRVMLPSIIDRDFLGFTSALERVQLLTGAYFAGAQGGIFCCPESELVAGLLKELGARGIGQSSWGPLVYGFYEGVEAARRAARLLPSLAEREGVELAFVAVGRPRNRGARIVALDG